MMSSTMSAHRRLFAVSLLACTAVFSAHAQQTPITGQMLAPTAPADAVQSAPAPMNPPPAMPSDNTETPVAETQVGDVTHQLLSMQAQGTRAGKHLSIPGQEASASYQRYLKSFEHSIPEFYDTTMSKSTSGSSNTSGSP
jgi:hypothetical protein